MSLVKIKYCYKIHTERSFNSNLIIVSSMNTRFSQILTFNVVFCLLNYDIKVYFVLFLQSYFLSLSSHASYGHQENVSM